MKAIADILRRSGTPLQRVVLILALLGTIEASAHGTTVKVVHAEASDSSLHTRFIEPWAKQLEQASAGHLRLQLTPGASIAPATLLAQVRQGDIEIACVAIPKDGTYPLLEQFAASGANDEEASRALWEYIESNDIAKQELKGVRLLAAAARSTSQESNVVSVTLLLMNTALYKRLDDETKKAVQANSGAETSARLGTVLGAKR